MGGWSFIVPDTRNLVHDTRPSIFNSVSADSLHTAGVVDNEADSEADSNDDTDQILSSINRIYEMIFQNLGEYYCPRPAEIYLIPTGFLRMLLALIHAFLLVLLFYQYFNCWNQLIRPFQTRRTVKST